MNQAEPPTAGIEGLLLTAAALILLSMCFSASESAFLSINKLRIRFLRSKKNKKAALTAKLLEKKEALLNTILVANNIVNISLSAVLTSIAVDMFGPAGAGIAALAATVILLIFGEITPKTIGSHHPESTAFLFAPFLRAAMIILAPVVALTSAASRILAKTFGISVKQHTETFTEEEIKNFIEVGEEEGVLESGEKTMMHRVFKFTDLSAKDIMVPRTNITAVHISCTYYQLIQLSQKSHLSRFPVYDRDIDDIKGVVFTKDALKFAGSPADFSVKKIMRPPHYILENKKMSSIQQTLRENNQSIAIVIDEYSGTAGLLTMEDISQEIFGRMYDEFDISAAAGIVVQDDNSLLISGDTRLIDLNEKLHTSLSSEFYETAAGWLSEKLDRIPQKGDQYSEQNYVFVVDQASERKIEKVLIAKEDAE